MPSWHAEGQLHLDVWKFLLFSVTKTKLIVHFVDYQRAREMSAVWPKLIVHFVDYQRAREMSAVRQQYSLIQ